MVTVSGLWYGEWVVRREGARFVVDRADPIVAVRLSLLVSLCADGAVSMKSHDEFLLAGAVLYRPIGIDDGRNLICQRIDPDV